MGILTDVKDGPGSLDPFTGQLGDEWELVASGEGTPTPWNQWDCEFSVQFADSGNLCALRLDDYGDTTELGEDEYPDVTSEVVAIWVDPPEKDQSFIVCELMKRYREDGGKYIELFTDIGRFDLDEYWDV